MNFHRIALMAAVLAVPCTANAFWFGSNGSCGGCNACAPSGDTCCESSCGSHGGSFGGCFSHLFSHSCCGSCGGWSMGCGCESNCGCSSCGCGHEVSSCGCGGEMKEESKPESAAAPTPAKEEKKEAAKSGKK